MFGLSRKGGAERGRIDDNTIARLAVTPSARSIDARGGVVCRRARALPPYLCSADAGDARSGFERSTAEAISSFGDGRMLVEKYIEDGHHIEIQARMPKENKL